VGIGTVAGVVSIGAIRHAMTPPPVAPKPIATVAAAAAPQARDAILRNEPAAPAATPPETTPPEEAPAAAQPTRAARRASEPIARAEPAARTQTETPNANREPAAPIAATSQMGTPVQPPAPAANAPTPSMLAAEVAMLDQARSAVSAKNGERALDVLGRYERQFPSGTLNLEATVLRIEALYLTGSGAAATALGREFLASHPSSTHAEHVRRLLAEHQKP
jgi:hypothetical protein